MLIDGRNSGSSLGESYSSHRCPTEIKLIKKDKGY